MKTRVVKNASHTLAYSIVALQEMNLAYKYPIIYWNCACLINDAGGDSGSTDYDKVAVALSKAQKENIKISLVNINSSDFTFKPDEKNNQILVGLKGINRVGTDLINEIIEHRPYSSLVDFYERIKPNKAAMISLIKSGAFDEFDSRVKNMVNFIWLTCDKKKNLTLQNMASFIKYNLLPTETEEQKLSARIYEFNRYLKNECKFNSENYKLDSRAIDFLSKIEKSDLLDNDLLNIKQWDKQVYQPAMDVYRNWISENKQDILYELNKRIFKEDWDKYTGNNNLSAWEMESLCFYYHDHELKGANFSKYGISDFFKLNPQPIVERTFKKGDSLIPIYRLDKICGTCIAKNKTKSLVYLLTLNGVVTVKFRKEYFALFDKQISERTIDGTKKILEKSWFNKGNIIVVQGIRREDEFVAKKYASSSTHTLYHIDEVLKNGELVLRHDRAKGDLEDEQD